MTGQESGQRGEGNHAECVIASVGKKAGDQPHEDLAGGIFGSIAVRPARPRGARV